LESIARLGESYTKVGRKDAECMLPAHYLRYLSLRRTKVLKPVENPFRERKSLNGLWQFSVDRDAEGHQQQWWLQPLPAAREIPVPSSYNDIFPEAEIRDHVGDVWYQTETFIPAG
jgi:Beta-galactosidase/beta-glucuronidase